MSIYVSGSLAFDRIMTFKGNLHDHILMDKLRMISVSFMVDSMDERRGGCAGNIAYSLALLGEKPVLVAAAGRDFDGYAAFLRNRASRWKACVAFPMSLRRCATLRAI